MAVFGSLPAGSLQSSAVRLNTPHCGPLYYCAVQFSAVQCSAVQWILVQCSAVYYSTVHYSIVQFNAVEFSSLQCSIYSAVLWMAIGEILSSGNWTHTYADALLNWEHLVEWITDVSFDTSVVYQAAACLWCVCFCQYLLLTAAVIGAAQPISQGLRLYVTVYPGLSDNTHILNLNILNC